MLTPTLLCFRELSVESEAARFRVLGGPRDLNPVSTEDWPGGRSYLTVVAAGSEAWLLFAGRGVAEKAGRDGRLNDLWTFTC